MNKKELIEKISVNSGLSLRQSEKALNELIHTISEELKTGDVRLVGFGTFAVTERPGDRKSTRLNSSHVSESRMPSSA